MVFIFIGVFYLYIGFLVGMQFDCVNLVFCFDVNSCNVFIWRIDDEGIMFFNIICVMRFRYDFLVFFFVKSRKVSNYVFVENIVKLRCNQGIVIMIGSICIDCWNVKGYVFFG